MANFPITIEIPNYGSFSSTYSWYVRWYQYPTNTSTITSSATITFGKPKGIRGDNYIVPVSINNIDNISRLNNSGYNGIAPTFTYTTTPTITLTSSDGTKSIVLYNSSVSNTVAAAQRLTTSTGSVIHNNTVDVEIPASMFDESLVHNISISNVVLINDTSATSTFNGSGTISFESSTTYQLYIDWLDEVNEFETRPETLNLNVYLNNEIIGEFVIDSSSLTEENTWSTPFHKLNSEQINGMYFKNTNSLDYNITTLIDLTNKIIRITSTLEMEEIVLEPNLKDNNNVHSTRNDYNSTVRIGNKQYSFSNGKGKKKFPKRDSSGNENSYNIHNFMPGYIDEGDGVLRKTFKMRIGNGVKPDLSIKNSKIKKIYLGDAVLESEEVESPANYICLFENESKVPIEFFYRKTIGEGRESEATGNMTNGQLTISLQNQSQGAFQTTEKIKLRDYSLAIASLISSTTGYASIGFYEKLESNSYESGFSSFERNTEYIGCKEVDCSINEVKEGAILSFNINSRKSLYPTLVFKYSNISGTFSCSFNNWYLFKYDDYSQLCRLAKVNPPDRLSRLLQNSEKMTAIFNSEEAVKWMVENCTGDFMANITLSATYKTYIDNSPHKTTILNNKHWSKFYNEDTILKR